MSTFDNMVDFVKSAWPARKFIVPCLNGPVGIGKTMAVRKAAEELGAGKVVTIIASQILPNEVSGITMPVPESKAMEIFDHYRLSSLEDGDVLFFDELLEADQLVLSACLTLIESRELMSGHKLPDILIVAATNPTIKPTMLKENIRQRFVFRDFELDREGVRKYIKDTCGFDVGMDIANQIVCEGDNYNILTPRSLTKMANWIAISESKDQVKEIANEINFIWRSALGTDLMKAYLKSKNDPERQVREAIKSVTYDAVVNSRYPDGVPDSMSDSDLFTKIKGVSFEDATIPELIEVLQGLPEWKEISDKLSQMQIEGDVDELECSF